MRTITPPWAVGLPAQVAARYAETATLREELAALIRALGLDVFPEVANFILCHLPPEGADAASIIKLCRDRGLYIRDPAMGSRLGNRSVRLAVKDRASNAEMAEIVADVLSLLGRMPAASSPD